MSNRQRSDLTPSHPNREVFDDALAKAGVLTDIVGFLADAAISGTKPPCGSCYLLLAELIEEQHERLRVLREAF